MAQALGICIRLLENNRSSDSVRKYVLIYSIDFTLVKSYSSFVILKNNQFIPLKFDVISLKILN